MKTLIFDFDGTIADSFEVMLRVASEVMALPDLSGQQISHLRQLPARTIAKELHIPFWRIPQLLFSGRRKMHRHIHEVGLFPGMSQALRTLHETGHTMLIVSSNSEQNVQRFLQTHNLEDRFQGIYGNVGLFGKARILRRIARQRHLDPRDCIYIGDEIRDVAAAKRAGVTPIAVAWGYQAPEALARAEPYALLQNPTELLKISGADRV